MTVCDQTHLTKCPKILLILIKTILLVLKQCITITGKYEFGIYVIMQKQGLIFLFIPSFKKGV